MMTWMNITFANPSSSISEVLELMHDYLVLILFSILIMVFINMSNLLFAKSFSLYFMENEPLEIVWTILPFIVITSVVVPSLTALYLLDSCTMCGLSVSIVGHQWYWSYFYKDYSAHSLDSYMLPSVESGIRLLDVDNRVLIPANVPVRCLLTSSDVIHSWAVPSLGVKMDAIPGRINQFCFNAKHSGVLFGQCSEICGANHSFMPIVLDVGPVSKFFDSI